MIVLATLLSAVAAGWLLERLHVPAGSFVGPMVVVAVVKLSGAALPDVPTGAKFVAFVVVGWLLGQDVEPGIVRDLASAVVPVLIAVSALLVVSGLLAWLLHHFGGMDKLTAFLATAPGGVAQMGVLAAAAQANVGIVIGLHLVRIISVVLVTPIVVRYLS